MNTLEEKKRRNYGSSFTSSPTQAFCADLYSAVLTRWMDDDLPESSTVFVCLFLLFCFVFNSILTVASQ